MSELKDLAELKGLAELIRMYRMYTELAWKGDWPTISDKLDEINFDALDQTFVTAHLRATYECGLRSDPHGIGQRCGGDANRVHFAKKRLEAANAAIPGLADTSPN